MAGIFGPDAPNCLVGRGLGRDILVDDLGRRLAFLNVSCDHKTVGMMPNFDVERVGLRRSGSLLL